MIELCKCCRTCSSFKRNFSSSSPKAKSGKCQLLNVSTNEIFYCKNHALIVLSKYYQAELNKLNNEET